MNPIDALRWTVLHRAISTAAFVAGFCLFGLGMVVGFGGAVEAFLNDPLDPAGAAAAANATALLAFALVGFLVWQFGKTFALYWTLPRATARRSARSVDEKRIRSEVLEALDGRLAEMESELEATRRAVERLEDGDRTQSYDETDGRAGTAPPSEGRPEGGSSSGARRPPSSPSQRTAPANAGADAGESTSTTERIGSPDDRA
ncbi:hypothetical protein [Halovivax sp.]|uniref:hypothetical protein n=1 Tax=Halovivax sp. TaxID=1935978 RepID=UPI0025B7F85B|nr:hypothetical protein [Halovivax sp.]